MCEFEPLGRRVPLICPLFYQYAPLFYHSAAFARAPRVTNELRFLTFSLRRGISNHDARVHSLGERARARSYYSALSFSYVSSHVSRTPVTYVARSTTVTRDDCVSIEFYMILLGSQTPIAALVHTRGFLPRDEKSARADDKKILYIYVFRNRSPFICLHVNSSQTCTTLRTVWSPCNRLASTSFPFSGRDSPCAKLRAHRPQSYETIVTRYCLVAARRKTQSFPNRAVPRRSFCLHSSDFYQN